MKRILLTGVMLLAIGAVGLAVDTKTDYDRSTNFANYHSFGWKAPKTPGNEVVSNSLVLSRIRDAVAENLSSKGFVQNATNPDIYIVAHVSAKDMKNVDYLPPLPGWRNWGWMGRDKVVYEYTKGTVILDVVDAKSNRLIWRAISTDTGSDLLDVQKEKTVEKMVSKSLEHFPPKTNVLG